MNERIKKLATEAGLQPFEDCGPGYVYKMEKFAELIVKECCKVIENGGYWSGGIMGEKRQATPPEIAQMIRDHFGVVMEQSEEVQILTQRAYQEGFSDAMRELSCKQVCEYERDAAVKEVKEIYSYLERNFVAVHVALKEAMKLRGFN